MGGSQSKGEPMVFQNEPSVPVELSPNLLRTLQGLPLEFPPSTPRGSKRVSDEDVDEIVASKVQRELDQHTQKRVAYEGRSADQIRREADDLQRRLKITPKPKPNPVVQAKEKAVLDCYRLNAGKPLDCWKEVEDLKTAVRQAHKDFAASFEKGG
ncbi:hypothetical protein BC829DRAFT_382715 [Chytridium lagenaria]|nr:hypothetical protein BC829DRAFT_382715 [Chytridium lagenaria]